MLLHQQRDARFQLQRTEEEDVISVVSGKRDSVAGGTLIDGFLDSRGVQVIFGGFRRVPVLRAKLRLQRSAHRRQLGFGDRTGVLR